MSWHITSKKAEESTIDYHMLETFLTKELVDPPTKEEIWETMHDLVCAWLYSRNDENSLIKLNVAEA